MQHNINSICLHFLLERLLVKFYNIMSLFNMTPP